MLCKIFDTSQMPTFLLLFLLIFPAKVFTSSPFRNLSPFSPLPSGDPAQIALAVLQTRLLLIFFAFFMLIFLLVCLIIGHFTWFADLKEQLELEHKMRLAEEAAQRRESEVQVEDAQAGPVENENVFADWEDFGEVGQLPQETECDPELCIPPHHSILCPNNRTIPALNEPLRLESLNTISSLGLATPVPIAATLQRNASISAIQRPITPSISPVALQSPQFSKNSRFVERDLESGRPVRSASVSPSQASSSSSPVTHPSGTLDISRLDLL